MPDITMCTNESCQLRHRCYRQTATPSDYQSYAEFKFDLALPSGAHCEHFYLDPREPGNGKA